MEIVKAGKHIKLMSFGSKAQSMNKKTSTSHIRKGNYLLRFLQMPIFIVNHSKRNIFLYKLDIPTHIISLNYKIYPDRFLIPKPISIE